MSWLAKKLMISFAVIAIILIIIISIVLDFSLTTVLIRVFAGSLIFSIIGGLLGEIIFRNIGSNNVGQNIDEIVDESEEEGTSNESKDDLDSAELDESMEPLEFEDLNNKDDNVINNIDGEQGAEIIREMSQDN
ncbi:MAG: hypothetical protein R6V17_05725 [Halanaerobacter sp.]